MQADKPPVANAIFAAPEDLEPSQVFSIHAFKGVVPSGSNLEGAEFVVVAWRPSPDDLKALNEGGLVYLSCLGGLPPHFITTNFSTATHGLIILK